MLTPAQRKARLYLLVHQALDMARRLNNLAIEPVRIEGGWP